MIITHKLSMDLQNRTIQPWLNMVQCDQNTRAIEVTLTDAGTAWEPGNLDGVRLRYRKSDGTVGSYDTLPDGTKAWTVDGNKMIVYVAPQMLTVPGLVETQLALNTGKKSIATFTFQIVVEEDPSAGTVESEDYVNWQQWIEDELDAYIQKVREDGEVLGGTMAGPLNMNGQTLSGLNVPAQSDHASNKGYVDQQTKQTVHRNLLDNSDFRNPVNQRGSSSYAVSGYTIDRWKSASADLKVDFSESEYIQIINSNTTTRRYFSQPTGIAAKAGEMYTMACYDKTTSRVKVFAVVVPEAGSYIDGGDIDGGVLRLINDATTGLTFAVVVNAGSAVMLSWVALYESAYSAETLPKYSPKGYSAELAECRRYYQRVGQLMSTGAAAVGFCFSATSARFVMSISPMRKANPTVTLVSTDSVPAVLCNGSVIARGALTFTANAYKDAQHMALVVTVEGGTQNASTVLTSNNACYFELSADL